MSGHRYTAARAICPYCMRNVAASTSDPSGEVWLRHHNKAPGAQGRCEGRGLGPVLGRAALLLATGREKAQEKESR